MLEFYDYMNRVFWVKDERYLDEQEQNFRNSNIK